MAELTLREKYDAVKAKLRDTVSAVGEADSALALTTVDVTGAASDGRRRDHLLAWWRPLTVPDERVVPGHAKTSQ